MIIDIPHGSAIMHEVMTRARTHPWRLIDFRFHGNGLPDDITPRGALVKSLPDSPLVKHLLAQKCPVIRLGLLKHPDDSRVVTILEDLYRQGAAAADHLHERCFRHAGYITYCPDAILTDLYRGFRDRTGERGISTEALTLAPLENDQTDRHSIYTLRRQQITEWLQRLPKPIGILACGEEAAGGLCSMVRDAGFRVPEEVSIITRQNSEDVCNCAPMPFSAVAPDYPAMAATAVSLMEQMLSGKPPEEKILHIPPSGVIARESTDMFACDDREVATALRYIWDHFRDEITIAEIAAEIGIPQRTLSRHFRESVGRGMNSVLRDRRIREAAMLLISSSKTIADITLETGIGSPEYLHRTFREVYGTTPRRYRRSAQAE